MGVCITACAAGCTATSVFCLDQDTVVILNSPEGPVKTRAELIHANDMILSPTGWTEVLEVRETGKNPVVELTLENGNSLKATETHLLQTSESLFVAAGDVEEGHFLATENGPSKVIKKSLDVVRTRNIVTEAETYYANGFIATKYGTKQQLMATMMKESNYIVQVLQMFSQTECQTMAQMEIDVRNETNDRLDSRSKFDVAKESVMQDMIQDSGFDGLDLATSFVEKQL